MRNVKNLALFVLMLALVSTAAVADTHYVVPGESIQAAIDAADPGDEIEVAPGAYLEAIDFIGKAIRLYSSGGPDVTLIDGQGAYHVVQCISGEGPDTILEGFIITGGANYFGGGMYNENSSPTVTNCTFIFNTANWFGGGMYNDNSSPTVTNCTFFDNTANYGGGMENYDSSPTVTNCIFSSNTAYSGGGMDNDENSSPTVTDCTFSGNNADMYGGGMYNEWCNSPIVAKCNFLNNTAGWGGGGMENYGSSPKVTNCTFSDNSADFYGGGMENYDNASPTVTNCTFTGNNAGGEFIGASIVTYCDVQGGTGQTWFGEGCIDADPLFADADGRLSLGSPCIDAGNDAAVPPGVTTDLDGNPRIQCVCVDMGAFESEFTALDFSGWIWMESDSDFGYSSDEDDLLYFLSFGPVWYYNPATSLWGEEGPVGWTYVNWPYLYESDTSTMMFALPPADGLWVFHFKSGEFTVSPQIIPW